MYVPSDVQQVLTDKSISLIDRIKYAEDRKTEGWYNCDRVMTLIGVPSTTYYRHRLLIKAKNDEIYHRVATGRLSVTTAVDLLRQMDYPFRGRLERMGASIIYIGSRHVIYRYRNRCYLAVAYPSRTSKSNSIKETQYREKLYRIDDKSYAIDTIVKMIEDGYSIGADLLVRTPDWKWAGALRHHLYAAYHKENLDQILREKVEYKQKKKWPSAGVVCADLRIANLIGPVEKRKSSLVTGKTVVVRRGKDIVIIRRADGLVTYTDYSPALHRVLNGYGALHTKSEDKRLSLYIDDEHDVYVYHLRLIEHLYGLPEDTEGLIANIDRFRVEQLGQEYIVDHLDNDCHNNRLSNLMPMTIGQNNVKKSIKESLEKIGYPFFLWAERYDNTSITMQAGYISQFKRPCYMVEGVFTVKEFLEEAQRFVDCAREECTINEEFDKLENELKKQEENRV